MCVARVDALIGSGTDRGVPRCQNKSIASVDGVEWKYWRTECFASEFITPFPHNSMSLSVWIFTDRGVGLKRGQKPFTQGDGIRVAA